MWSAIITWIGVGIHIIACFGLIACAEGLEAEENFGHRFTWVLANLQLWTATWLLWSLASMSLVAFAFVWSGELLRRHAPAAAVWTGFSLIATGLLFDQFGVSLYIFRASESADYNSFHHLVLAYTRASVVIANGLYCVGGLILSILAFRSGWLTGPMAYVGMVMWLDGLLLSAAGLAYERLMMVATGAVLMMLFIPWSAWVGWRMLPRLDRRERAGV